MTTTYTPACTYSTTYDLKGRDGQTVTVLDADAVTMTSRVVFPDGYRAVVPTRHLTETTTTQENAMTADTTRSMFDAPAVTQYRSLNQGTDKGTQAFREAAIRLTGVAYVPGDSAAFPMDLMDYLAERVVAHSFASRRAIADLMRDVTTQEQVQDMAASMKATETEAARTLLVAAGIRPEAIAPVDYPTLVQVYVNARNAAGYRFPVKRG